MSLRATRLAIGGVLLGLLLAAVNQTIVITALPRIAEDLDALDDYSWVLIAFLLTLTVATPIVGQLSDIFGRRRFLLAGACLFIIGGLVSATAASLGGVVAGRAIQGLGSAALIPLAAVVIGDLVPPAERGRWQGLVGAVTAVAAVVGPTVGGWIADNASWRWVFLASLPFAFVAMAVMAVTLRIPRHPDRDTRVDYPGALILVGTVSSLIVAVAGDVPIRGELFALGAVLLAVFVWWELRTEQPILPVSLFRVRTFTVASAASLTTGIGLFVTITYTPLFVQAAMGKSAASSALALTPMMLAMTVASVGAGHVIVRTGRYRWALVGGAILVALASTGMTRWDAATGQGLVTATVVCAGLGFGLIVQNLVLVIQNAVPSRHLGAATASGRFFHTTGGTIGIGVTGILVAAGLPRGASLDAMAERAGAAGAAPMQEAIVDALHPVFTLGLPVAGVLFVLTCLIPEMPLRRAVRDDVRVPATAPESAAP